MQIEQQITGKLIQNQSHLSFWNFLEKKKENKIRLEKKYKKALKASGAKKN